MHRAQLVRVDSAETSNVKKLRRANELTPGEEKALAKP